MFRRKTRGPIELPRCGDWMASLVLRSPADCRASWPLYPFDEESASLNYENGHIGSDSRQRCYPRREHLASFRRWKPFVPPHEPCWRTWGVRLTGQCGVRESDLPSLDIPKICDYLDEADVPQEQERIAKTIRSIAEGIQSLDRHQDRNHAENECRYLACIAADMFAKGREVPQQLRIIGIAFCCNGLEWFFGALARHMDIAQPDGSFVSRGAILMRLADAIAPAGLTSVRAGRAVAVPTEREGTADDSSLLTSREKAAKKLQPPTDRAIKTYRAIFVSGIRNQTELATYLTREGVPTNQGQVSRDLKTVTEFIVAGGVLPDVFSGQSDAQAVDPSRLALGKRTDGRTKRQREKGRD